MSRKMHFSWLLLGAIVLSFLCFSNGNLTPGGRNVCTSRILMSYLQSYQQGYTAYRTSSYSCYLRRRRYWWRRGYWGRCYQRTRYTAYRTAYRTRYRYQNRYVCCSGWSRRGSTCPIPICTHSCIRGTCIRPNQCQCSAGYSGNRCQYDRNECASRLTHRCQQNCINTVGSYRCSCRAGYRLVGGRSCSDINECTSRSTHNCQHNCINTIGSYRCSCRSGYRLVNGRTCSDISECTSRSTHSCQHNCINTIGSYRCSCRSGYRLVNGRTCSDINECTSRTTHSCQQNCINTVGSYRCSCNSGYSLMNGRSCVDVDECASRSSHSCQHNCINTIGSYRCSCNVGYRLDTWRTCSDINECASRSLNNCQQSCTNTIGSYRCSCRSGYSLRNGNSCVDINECVSRSTHSCQQNCTNTVGSYRCSCNVGYRSINNARTCQDINECTSRLTHNCQHDCINTVGSYRCSCNTGFRLESDGRRCEDIDECAGVNKCQHFCHNTVGSYSCSCRAGYTLQVNGNCTDINECGSSDLNTCQHICHNQAGTYECSCRAGYTLHDNGTCTDVNECNDDGLHDCQHYCHNHEGRYSCSCFVGYQLNVDGSSCSDIDECVRSENNTCQHNCHNTIGSYTCSCRTGYNLEEDGSCTDINECSSESTNVCEHNCTNTIGSYQCSCRAGYTLHQNGSCTDINECASNSTNTCEHYCTNTNGSYECSCEDGYTLHTNGSCSDNDECLIDATNDCQQICTNIPGSYQCSCRNGYRLNHDGRLCDDIDECKHSNTNNCQHFCHNTNGSFHCSCEDGYALQNNGSCFDINECSSTELNTCAHFCHNSIGSYECSCRAGYILHQNGSCSDINECASNSTNTCEHYCTNTNGSYECSCDDGYTLHTNGSCSDINECAFSELNTCQHFCHNTIGSYQCSCEDGYILHQNGSCSDVDECASNSINTCEHYCTNTNGSYECSCKDGYTLHGNGTCSDNNECSNNSTNNCQQICTNIPGSYQCSCNVGWKLIDGNACKDIDECKHPDGNNCEHFCHNTNGSFYCSCEGGYALRNNGRCIDVNECASSELNTCDHYCTNVIGSYECSCKRGYTLHANGSCSGLPCGKINPPTNGNLNCSGHVTDEYCNVTCNDGFHLIGSNTTYCLPSTQWSVPSSICQRRSCGVFQPRPNTSVLIPCGELFESVCLFYCPKGYFLEGQKYVQCEFRDNDMVWNGRESQCKKKTICQPNPCLHGGKCTKINTNNSSSNNKEDKFECDCSKTGYSGENCSTPVATVTSYIRVYGMKTRMSLQVQPDPMMTIKPFADNLTFIPSKKTVTSSNTRVHFDVVASKAGLYKIQYEVEDGKGGKSTGEVILRFLSHNDVVSSPYKVTDFPVLDFYQHSCFSRPLFTLPDVQLTSSCNWNEDRTNGITSVQSSTYQLPLSILGYSRTYNQSNGIRNFLDDGKVERCKETCNSSINLTQRSVDNLLRFNVFSIAYVKEVTRILPTWLQINIELVDLTYTFSNSFSQIINGKTLATLPSCTNIPVIEEHMYSVFSSSLPLSINVIIFQGITITRKQTCVAVDLTNDQAYCSFGASVDLITSQSQMIRSFSASLISWKPNRIDLTGKAVLKTKSFSGDISLNGAFRAGISRNKAWGDTLIFQGDIKYKVSLKVLGNILLLQGTSSFKKDTVFIDAENILVLQIQSEKIHETNSVRFIAKKNSQLKIPLDITRQFTSHSILNTEEIKSQLETLEKLNVLITINFKVILDKNMPGASTILIQRISVFILLVRKCHVLLTGDPVSYFNVTSSINELKQSSVDLRSFIKLLEDELDGNTIALRTIASIYMKLKIVEKITVKPDVTNLKYIDQNGFNFTYNGSVCARKFCFDEMLVTLVYKGDNRQDMEVSGEFLNQQSVNPRIEIPKGSKLQITMKQNIAVFSCEVNITVRDIDGKMVHGKLVFSEKEYRLTWRTTPLGSNLMFDVVVSGDLETVSWETILSTITGTLTDSNTFTELLERGYTDYVSKTGTRVQTFLQEREHANRTFLQSKQSKIDSEQKIKDISKNFSDVEAKYKNVSEQLTGQSLKLELAVKTQSISLMNIKNCESCKSTCISAPFCSICRSPRTIRQHSFQCNRKYMSRTLTKIDSVQSSCYKKKVEKQNVKQLSCQRKPYGIKYNGNKYVTGYLNTISYKTPLAPLLNITHESEASEAVIEHLFGLFSSCSSSHEAQHIEKIVTEKCQVSNLQLVNRSTTIKDCILKEEVIKGTFSEPNPCNCGNRKCVISIPTLSCVKSKINCRHTLLSNMLLRNSLIQSTIDLVHDVQRLYEEKEILSLERQRVKLLKTSVEAEHNSSIADLLKAQEVLDYYERISGTVLKSLIPSTCRFTDKNSNKNFSAIASVESMSFNTRLPIVDGMKLTVRLRRNYNNKTFEVPFDFSLSDETYSLQEGIAEVLRISLCGNESVDSDSTQNENAGPFLGFQSWMTNKIDASATQHACVTFKKSVAFLNESIHILYEHMMSIAIQNFSQSSSSVSIRLIEESIQSTASQVSPSMTTQRLSSIDLQETTLSLVNLKATSAIANRGVSSIIGEEVADLSSNSSISQYINPTLSTQYMKASKSTVITRAPRKRRNEGEILSSSRSSSIPNILESSILSSLVSNSRYDESIDKVPATTRLSSSDRLRTTVSSKTVMKFPSQIPPTTSTIAYTNVATSLLANETKQSLSNNTENVFAKLSTLENNINSLLKIETDKYRSMHSTASKLRLWKQSGEIYSSGQKFPFCLNFHDCVQFTLENLKLLPENSLSANKENFYKLINSIKGSFNTLFEHFNNNGTLDNKLVLATIEAIQTELKTLQSTSLPCSVSPRFNHHEFKKLHTKVGDMVELLCGQVENEIPVKYNWKHNGRYINGENKSSITFNATPNKVGLYTCVISTYHGSSESAGTFVSVYQPPSLKEHPKSRLIVLPHHSEEIALVCNVTGYPKPEIMWFYRDFENMITVPLNITSKYLLIRNFKVNKTSGFYHCEAKNDYGSITSKSARIDVLSSMPVQQKVTLFLELKGKMETNHTLLRLINNTKIINIQPHVRLIPHKNLTITINSLYNQNYTEKSMEELFNDTIKSRQNIAFALSFILKHLLQNNTSNNVGATNGTSSFLNNTGKYSGPNNGTSLNKTAEGHDRNNTSKNIETSSSVNGSSTFTNKTLTNETRSSSYEASSSGNKISGNETHSTDNKNETSPTGNDTQSNTKGIFTIIDPITSSRTPTNKTNAGDQDTNAGDQDANAGETTNIFESSSLVFKTELDTCDPGYELHDNGFICVQCSAGSYSEAGNKCTPCPRGMYQFSAGATRCLKCDEMKTTISPSGISETQCKVFLNSGRVSPALLSKMEMLLLIIGISLFAILVVIVICYCCCKRNRLKDFKSPMNDGIIIDNDDDDDDGSYDGDNRAFDEDDTQEDTDGIYSLKKIPFKKDMDATFPSNDATQPPSGMARKYGEDQNITDTANL